jgi:hypothetical protein
VRGDGLVERAPQVLGITGRAQAPSFEYPRSDAPASLHFVGPLSGTGSHAPLPDWWG